MLLTRLAILACACCIGIAACAQRTTRPKLKLSDGAKDTKTAIVGDTIANELSQVRVSGYEKTLRSTTESMFVTNNSPYSIAGICITIDYFDTSDRQLHQRTETVKVRIPPMQTRLVKLPSWDKQKVWYYALSDRTNTKSQATPYKVKITVNYFIAN